jgi:hypothetical protein
MVPTSAQTRSRVEVHLGNTAWPTAAELANDLHLSSGTVRSYLHDLVGDGRVERRNDPSVSSPRGSGADRFHVLAVPLGPPSPTADYLCEACVRVHYGDVLRYRRALTRTWEPRDDSCDRCEKPLYG